MLAIGWRKDVIKTRYSLTKLDIEAIIVVAGIVDVLSDHFVDLFGIVGIEADLVLVEYVDAASDCSQIPTQDLPMNDA